MATKKTELELSAKQSVIKSSLSLKILELGFNSLATEQTALIYNEDNLPAIKAFVDKVDKCIKKVNEEHEVGKAPYWEECVNWDKARRVLMGELDNLRQLPAAKNQEISTAIEKRKKEAAIAEAAMKEAKEKIDKKVLEFSDKITSATTWEQLRSIENEVNGVKGAATAKVNKQEDKQGVNALLIERLETIAPLIAAQKLLVKEDAAIDQQIEQAKSSGNEEELNDLMDKKELITAEISEKKQTIGSDIINLTTAPTSASVSYPSSYSYPEVKAKRKSWKARQQEGIDISKVASKWTKVVLDEEKIDAFLKEYKSGWDKNNQESVIDGGIEFYVEKKY